VSRRAVLGNFASLASLRVGLAALTFALFWFLSHRLSTAQLGGFSLLMNAFFMVQTVPLLGMGLPLIRRIAARPQVAARESSNSFFFSLPVAVLIGGALALTGIWYADGALRWPFALLGLSMLPSSWTVVAECVLVGREKMRGIAYVNLLEALGRLIGGIVAVSLGSGLTGLFAVFLCLRVCAALLYLCNPLLPVPSWRLVHGRVMLRYRRQLATYLSIEVVSSVHARIDIILLSWLLSLREVGIYAAATRLSDAAVMVPTMAAIVLLPTQSRLFESDRAAFVRLFERAVRWYLIAGFAAALAVVALAPFIVHLIYAPNLAQAASILQILILGASLMVVDQMLSTTQIAAKAQRADLHAMCSGLATLLVLLCVFSHFFGLAGAPMAPPAALLVRVLVRLYWAQKQFATRILGVALRVLAAAAVAIAVCFSHIAENMAVRLLLACACYAAALWATGSVRMADWQMLRDWLLRRPRHSAA
jgi:O-antigen/teichoic acid export membrane protein